MRPSKNTPKKERAQTAVTTTPTMRPAGGHNKNQQEAEKKIRLKRLPRVLTLHLKRFKYVESLENFSKLSHRVVFPLELRTPNMTDAAGEADADGRLYRQAKSLLFCFYFSFGRGRGCWERRRREWGLSGCILAFVSLGGFATRNHASHP